MNIIKWFKTVNRIIQDRVADQERFRREIARLEEESKRRDSGLGFDIKNLEGLIKDRTDMAVDVAPYGKESCVILVGRFKGSDYVQVIPMPESDFIYVVEHLRALSKHANLRRVDGPPALKYVVRNDMGMENL